MGRGSAWMRPYRRGDLRCAAMIWGDRSLHSPDALCSNCDFADSGGANPIFPRRLRRRAQSYLRRGSDMGFLGSGPDPTLGS